MAGEGVWPVGSPEGQKERAGQLPLAPQAKDFYFKQVLQAVLIGGCTLFPARTC